MKGLNATYESQLEVGGRTFKFIANPVKDDSGEVLGTVVEWMDRTAEVATEQEVENLILAAQQGNLAERMDATGKTGFVFSPGTDP